MGKQRIALVEDDEVLSKVISEELNDAGFDVEQAFDGQAGLELVQSKKPDLVLLDLLMPKMHGFEVLDQIKKKPETKTIPVIIMTMLGQDEDIKKGLKLGASDYIVKSQHAVGEIIDKVKDFFGLEQHPGGEEKSEQ